MDKTDAESTASAQGAGVFAPSDLRPVTLSDLGTCLRLGLRDFRKAPQFGLFFALVYVLGGWLITWALLTEGQIWWTIIAGTGFPILGPFIACGLYEVSRRIERGLPLGWRQVLGVILKQKDRQIPSMAAVVVVFFLFWNFLGHMIFALFLGKATLTNIFTSPEVFLTGSGLMMLGFGTVIGAGFAGVLYALTVVSLPLLLDREVDFITAMIISFQLVLQNPAVMLIWALLIAIALFAAMIPAFIGLFIVLPILGHASWHLYRKAIG